MNHKTMIREDLDNRISNAVAAFASAAFNFDKKREKRDIDIEYADDVRDTAEHQSNVEKKRTNEVFLERYASEIKGLYIDDDGDLACNGNISLSRLEDISDFIIDGYLTVTFSNVRNFSCANLNLKSLHGCPKNVEVAFDCENNQITSLEECCSENSCFTLCISNNPIESLVGCPQNVKKLHCANTLIKDLYGCPAELDYLNCSHCEHLTSFEGTLKDVVVCDCMKCTNLKDISDVDSIEVLCARSCPSLRLVPDNLLKIKKTAAINEINFINTAAIKSYLKSKGLL